MDYKKMIIDACKSGDIDTVRSVDLDYELADIALKHAANASQLAIVRYLLTDTGDLCDIHASNNYILRVAANNGDLDMVKFLLTSPELTDHADVSKQCFGAAASGGHMEVVRYLHHNFNDVIDIHQFDDVAFLGALENKHSEVLSYLIFDMHIEKTPAIAHALKRGPYPQSIHEAFDKRELFYKLQNDIPVENHPTPKKKL